MWPPVLVSTRLRIISAAPPQKKIVSEYLTIFRRINWPRFDPRLSLLNVLLLAWRPRKRCSPIRAESFISSQQRPEPECDQSSPSSAEKNELVSNQRPSRFRFSRNSPMPNSITWRSRMLNVTQTGQCWQQFVRKLRYVLHWCVLLRGVTVSVSVSYMEFDRNPTKTAENTGKIIIRVFLAQCD